MSNSNRFFINGLNWNIVANAGGATAEVGNEVFVAESYTAFRTLLADTAGETNPVIDLAGSYYAREAGENWESASPPTFNGTLTVQGNGGSISGALSLSNTTGNSWTRDSVNYPSTNVWEISTDGVTGNMPTGYYDYTDKWAKQVSASRGDSPVLRGVERTETTLNEVVDTNRGFVFMTDPNRDFYNEQPQAAVWPEPPDYAMRYPISLQSNWIPVVSNHATPVINGQVFTQKETDFFADILNGEGTYIPGFESDPLFYSSYSSSNLNNNGSGNIVVGFKISNEAVKTQIRQMLVNLKGAAKCTTPGNYATAKPWMLSCCVRSGPNDIDDAQIKSWNEVAPDPGLPRGVPIESATNDIEIFFHRDSIDIFRSGSGYVEFIFQGDRSFITQPGGWVVERPHAVNGEEYVINDDTKLRPVFGEIEPAAGYVQPVPKQAKTIVYWNFGAVGDVPDLYYPVASDLFNNNKLQPIDFYDTTFVGGGRAINGYSAGAVSYAIAHTNVYDTEYYLANGHHNPNEPWTNLYGCKLGYCYFGNRGMVNMYDCYSTDIMKIAQGVADGSINERSVFCGAWQRETIIVLGGVGSSSCSNMPVRRTKVKDCLFYQAMTNHGQGVSFYADANLNCEMSHCLFVDCQRSFSTQPNSRKWTSNNPGPGKLVESNDLEVNDGYGNTVKNKGNCSIFNNMAVMNKVLDAYSPPGQADFTNNGGSDYWVNQDYQYYYEHNSQFLNPDLYWDYYASNPKANQEITHADLLGRSAFDIGSIYFARCAFRNNVWAFMKSRVDPINEEFEDVVDNFADIATTVPVPTKDHRVIVKNGDAQGYHAYLWDSTWGWIPTRAKIYVHTTAERNLLGGSFKELDTPVAYTNSITGKAYDIDRYEICADKETNKSYQWRSLTDPEDPATYAWNELASDPYTDRITDYVDSSDTGRKDYYMEGNLTLGGFNNGSGPQIFTGHDLGNLGDYLNVPADETSAVDTVNDYMYKQYVYTDGQEISLNSFFNGQGVGGRTPGVLWDSTPTPEVLRSLQAENFKSAVSDVLIPENGEGVNNTTWYTRWKEGNPVTIAAVLGERLETLEWDTAEATTPDYFGNIIGTSGSYDGRPVSGGDATEADLLSS